MTTESLTSRRAKQQTGFSLIEILVVLVVLVVGILAIVRLFPAGFIALRNAQNSTFADRLGQAELEALKQDPGTLADAVYMYTPGQFNPGIAPDNLTASGPDPSYNDINKQRYISNETITVPAPHIIANVAYPPLHTLSFGPIYLPTVAQTLTPGSPALPYLTVNGTPWTAMAGDSRFDASDPNSVTSPQVARHITNPQDVLASGQQQYLVDLAAGQLALPPADYPQSFVLTVTTATTTQTVTLTIPASSSYAGGWFNTLNGTLDLSGTPTNPLPSAATSPWTSVSLYRPFVCLGRVNVTAAPTFSGFDSDPYEYYVYGDDVGVNANMGVIAFNPHAAGHNGTQPLKAQVSYMTLNWHVLHEDHDVQDGGGAVKLILDHLKRVNDVQFDGTTFAGLVPPTTTGGTTYDIMLLNLDTGNLVPFTSAGVNDLDNSTTAPTGSATKDISVSYSAGQLLLPAAYGGQHLRVFYAGDADWGVALQKAPSTYTAASGPVTQATVNNLKAITTNLPNQYAVFGTRIYFPPCDSGKTVEIDGLQYTLNGAVQPPVPLVSAVISDAADASGNYYVDLGPLGAGVVSSGGTVSNVTVTGVRGVSARAVVIWHERNNWRMRATDTLLTRSQ